MKKNMYCALGVCAFVLLSMGACKKKSSDSTTPAPSNQFTDSRDNNVYTTVTIGTQTWMATSLKYNTSASICPTGDCATYGVYYTYPDAKTACPSGYHLPSDGEWQTLEYNLGMLASDTGMGYGDTLRGRAQLIGTKLQVGGSSGLNFKLSGSYFGNTSTYFPSQVGNHGYYWTSTIDPANSSNAFVRVFDNTNVSEDYRYSISNSATNSGYLCIRCLKN